MKRTIAFLPLCLLLLFMMSTTAMAHTCVDQDRDYWCDDCGMLIWHKCVDYNKDTWCDKCSCWIPHDCYDNNADCECDQCGKVMDVYININVTSFLSPDHNVHLVFFEKTYPSVIANIYGFSASHSFRCAANTFYQLQINKPYHVPRIYFGDTKNSDIDLNVKLCPYGDVSQDGTVDMGDVAQTYAYTRSTIFISDEYALKCADTNGDEEVNMGDVASIYAHVRGTKPLH